MTRLLPAIILLICVTACKKDNDSSSIVGKWEQTDFFDGRVAGGCFCWEPVNEIGAYQYEFKNNGSYTSTPPMYSSLAVCVGKWHIVNDSTLALTNCGTTTETLHWFKKEGKTLTIAFDIPNVHYEMKFKKVRTF